MSELRSYRLDVPGARITYDVGGDGPPLMFLGSPMDAGGFRPVADRLSADFTVITYDPRTIGRSVSDDPDADTPPEVQADDAHRVLETIGLGPAGIFGSSGGAVTALALCTWQSAAVTTMIAHEPPLIDMLDDVEDAHRNRDAIAEAYRTGGVAAGIAKFAEWTGLMMPGQQGPPPDPDVVKEQRRVAEFLLGHLLFTTTGYQPDLAHLETLGDRMIIGVGATSGDQLARRAAEGLARRLGLTPHEFPGGHAGFLEHPQGFAAVLRELFRP